MKEDLIVLPTFEAFESIISDARSDLQELEVEENELKDRKELALYIVDLLDEETAKLKNKQPSFKEKVGLAAHLYLLENVLEELFEDTDGDFFFEDEDYDDESEADNPK